MASVLRAHVDADVDIVDLDMERAFGPVDLREMLRPGYDIVGISCYSSYDYLKVMVIAAEVKRLLPTAWLVTGGYHASARPNDFTGVNSVTGERSPFDFVIIGDGEGPLLRLVRALDRGTKPLNRIVGPESLADPNDAAYDWSLLERYRPIARQVASQAEIYLSRGCPFDCAFCMERAKRDVSWRALDPLRAVEEIHRLDRFLDLRRWTLFVADALFGMKSKWRKTFLEELARRPCRARKVWLLIRVDLIDREDLELMRRANVSPGFGLESGDPAHLKRIRKAGRLDNYLEHMLEVAEWARELDVPFGANVIVGHPGETEQTMRTSAAYLKKLFLGDSRGTTGFLSVDPFRLYPGSPIDEDIQEWKQQTGMRVHRYRWWHDGDQDFLAEWIDPSDELDFRRTLQLRRELFDPIVKQIPGRYVYGGPARDYYLRAIDEQVEICSPRRYAHTLGLWHLWRDLTDSSDAARIVSVAGDDELATISAEARVASLERQKVALSPALRSAIEAVPRERFVSLEHLHVAAQDVALPLTDDCASTISAMHAYVAAFEALELQRGDSFVELGGGTGYGAALASEIVGEEGKVLSLELERSLCELAQANLAQYAQTTFEVRDAHEVERWTGATKVYAAFAIDGLPAAWERALKVGGKLVAPVQEGSGESQQQLMLFERTTSGVLRRRLGSVIYVPDRAPVRRQHPTS